MCLLSFVIFFTNFSKILRFKNEENCTTAHSQYLQLEDKLCLSFLIEFGAAGKQRQTRKCYPCLTRKVNVE